MTCELRLAVAAVGQDVASTRSYELRRSGLSPHKVSNRRDGTMHGAEFKCPLAHLRWRVSSKKRTGPKGGFPAKKTHVDMQSDDTTPVSGA